MRATGFWGVPGGIRSTQTHCVTTSPLKAACGSRVGRLMEFQWCAMGWHRVYVECQRCRAFLDRQPKGETR